jgi:hypothetical protein
MSLTSKLVTVFAKRVWPVALPPHPHGRIGALVLADSHGTS